MHWRNLLIVCLLFFAAGCATERVATDQAATTPAATDRPAETAAAPAQIERAKADELAIRAHLAADAPSKARAYYELFAHTGARAYLLEAVRAYNHLCLASTFTYGCGAPELEQAALTHAPDEPAVAQMRLRKLATIDEAAALSQLLAHIKALRSNFAAADAEQLGASADFRQAVDLSMQLGARGRELARALGDLGTLGDAIVAQAALNEGDFALAAKRAKSPQLGLLRLQALLGIKASSEEILTLARELGGAAKPVALELSRLFIEREQAEWALEFAPPKSPERLQAFLMQKNYPAASEEFLHQPGVYARAYSLVYALLAGAPRADELERELAKLPPNADLQNTYGYYLIDSGADVSRGVDLVRKALAEQPQNAYFMDSLAWGLYKLGRCEEALAAILRALELGVDAAAQGELKEHERQIKKCKN